MKTLTLVEIDVTYCSLEYGVLPCQAELGVTGEVKCTNTLKTCQDRENFTDSPVTLRFAEATEYLPLDVDAVPCVRSVSLTPATVSLGGDLGQRASLSVSFDDFRHSDAGPGMDKYWRERGYDPFRNGTFWGRFRARQPFLQGRNIRLIRGELGQDISEMETRHFVIESFTGPDTSGVFTIVAKDALKLADGDRAQAPHINHGFLIADITAGDGVALITPSGIGDAEYATSGHVAIGGTEICAFTRSGDSLTITRAQHGTEAVSHSAQDRVQQVLIYEGETPAAIIHDLLTSYASVDPSFIDLPVWEEEVNTHLRRLYGAVIPEPTSVRDLVSEVIEQAALAVWWDDLSRQVRLQVLRPIVSEEVYGEDLYMERSLRVADQPDTRISEVWTYYGQINPLQPVTDESNYRSVRADVDLQATSDYGTPSIKKILSRWIPPFGSQVAIRLNQIVLGRYRDPPRRFTLDVLRDSVALPPEMGGGYRLAGWMLQSELGEPISLPIQVTRLSALADRWSITAEEANFVQFDEEDLQDRVITIDGSFSDLNLRDIHDGIYPEPDPDDLPTLTCIVNDGVTISSTSSSRPAFDVGSWPAGMDVSLVINGVIQGCGGRGGSGASGEGTGGTGGAGGVGLYTRFPVSLDLAGSLRGGGGGGGGGGSDFVGWFGPQVNGGGGGGGAGYGRGGTPAWPSEAGSAGSLTAGGVGGRAGEIEFGNGTLRTERAGSGGPPGGSGGSASGHRPGSGGPAGPAVDGWSYITTGTVTGTYLGSRIN